MCTLTWLQEGSRFELFDNRDERRTRAPAAPPRQETVDGVRYLAPVDGDFGGTWVSVNDRALVLCLLNRYLERGAEGREDFVSRGLLVRDLATSPEPSEVARRLAALDLEAYRPFTLFVATPAHPPRIWISTGGALAEEVPEQPLVSAPRAAEIRVLRRRTLARMIAERGGEDAALHLDFHRSHRPFRGPLSVCMHHLRAQTVSFTHVVVDDGEVVMTYQDGSPCRSGRRQTLRLERQPDPVATGGGGNEVPLD